MTTSRASRRYQTPHSITLTGKRGKLHTAKATEGLLRRFEREIDPDGVLAPDERRRRALLLRRAHMLQLARKSAQVRRERIGL